MPDFTIIEHYTIDSTNNYAMQLIDANKALHGLTITAQSQTGGKGQRGKEWLDAPGKCLLMSIIINPKQPIQEQFSFNASVAVAIAGILQNIYKNLNIRVKWPNDIIVNDKKAGGILIENVLRGSLWAHSVIGLGLNVKQENLPGELPFATSLKIASGRDCDIVLLRDELHAGIMDAVNNPLPPGKSLEQYNEYLYKRGQKQIFNDSAGQWEATIINAHTDGTLELQMPDGTIACYRHGQVAWVWGA